MGIVKDAATTKRNRISSIAAQLGEKLATEQGDSSDAAAAESAPWPHPSHARIGKGGVAIGKIDPKGALGIGVAGGPALTVAIQVNLHRLRGRHAVRQHNLAAEVKRAPAAVQVRSSKLLLLRPLVGVVGTSLLTTGGWKVSRTSATATGRAARAAGRAATASAAVLLRPDSRSKQQTQNGSQNLDPLHDHPPFRVFRLQLSVRHSQQPPPTKAFGSAVRRRQQQKGCGTGVNTIRSRPDALAGRGIDAVDVWQPDRFEVTNRAWISHQLRTVPHRPPYRLGDIRVSPG